MKFAVFKSAALPLQIRCSQPVCVSARDCDRGDKAVADLKKEGLNPLFHQLDINDTVNNFECFIMVHNAACF